MSKQYNTKLQERLEKFLKDENLSQAKAARFLESVRQHSASTAEVCTIRAILKRWKIS